MNRFMPMALYVLCVRLVVDCFLLFFHSPFSLTFCSNSFALNLHLSLELLGLFGLPFFMPHFFRSSFACQSSHHGPHLLT